MKKVLMTVVISLGAIGVTVALTSKCKCHEKCAK